jgi:hypothetical protein
MNNYQNLLTEKHIKIVNFFMENRFGSNMPILTYFSTLDPLDRCIILEKIFELKGGSIVLFDKLVLAYVKVGRIDLAELVIETAQDSGVDEMYIEGMEDKLIVGVPPERTRQQRLDMFKDYLARTEVKVEIQFLNLLIKFIE